MDGESRVVKAGEGKRPSSYAAVGHEGQVRDGALREDPARVAASTRTVLEAKGKNQRKGGWVAGHLDRRVAEQCSPFRN